MNDLDSENIAETFGIAETNPWMILPRLTHHLEHMQRQGKGAAQKMSTPGWELAKRQKLNE